MKGLNGNCRKKRSEVAITNVFERSVNQPQKDPDVKMLSLGVGSQSLISKENENEINEYGETHFSIRAVPDRMEMEILALYVSNISQSSASSLEIARKAMMSRRVGGTSGSAYSEVAKRSRRQQSKKLSKRRRKQEIQAEVSAAKLIEKEGKESFSKFRACCNQPRKDAKDEQGDYLAYQGIEDRWLHDMDYRARQIASNYCADQDVARHRDCLAAIFF